MERTEKGTNGKKALTPWRPFGDMARWEREMERIFDNFLGKRWPSAWSDPWLDGKEGITVPAIDLYEEKDEIVAKAEIPGIDKADVQVNITDHLLTIKGAKKKEEEIKQEDYYRAERTYGSFVRNVELPKEVQVDKARATFKNGVLEVRLPKTEAAKKSEVKVKVE